MNIPRNAVSIIIALMFALNSLHSMEPADYGDCDDIISSQTDPDESVPTKGTKRKRADEGLPPLKRQKTDVFFSINCSDGTIEGISKEVLQQSPVFGEQMQDQGLICTLDGPKKINKETMLNMIGFMTFINDHPDYSDAQQQGLLNLIKEALSDNTDTASYPERLINFLKAAHFLKTLLIEDEIREIIHDKLVSIIPCQIQADGKYYGNAVKMHIDKTSQVAELVPSKINDINAVINDNDDTRLHYACQNRDPELVKLLLYMGANPNTTNLYNEMPISLLFNRIKDYANNKNVDTVHLILRWLIKCKAQVNMNSGKESSILSRAYRIAGDVPSYIKIAEFLIKKGACFKDEEMKNGLGKLEECAGGLKLAMQDIFKGRMDLPKNSKC